jgi:hypothetical protein
VGSAGADYFMIGLGILAYALIFLSDVLWNWKGSKVPGYLKRRMFEIIIKTSPVEGIKLPRRILDCSGMIIKAGEVYYTSSSRQGEV